MTELNFTLEDLLTRMVQASASDLHIKAGCPPGFRIDGEILVQDQYPVLYGEDVRTLAYQILTQEQIDKYEATGDLDCSYSVPNISRFRVNLLTQRESPGIVIRQIPSEIPTAVQLGLPKVCIELASKPRGLVLVTGPTGSGKSTTLASMIDHINENSRGHILTMEDPLEFLHPDKGCFVTQRQIGSDCKDFQQALRRALRQDPDVILIGEMRDLETIELAITAAETGHLVLGTLHTTSAISTVDRMIDVFPPDAQQQVRIQLASTLQGVISQTLCPKMGGGRVAAHEILVATDGVRSLIREGKTPQILNFLQTGSKHGMITLEQSLANLVERGLVLSDDAKAKSNRPTEIPEDKYKGRERRTRNIDPENLPKGLRRRATDPGGSDYGREIDAPTPQSQTRQPGPPPAPARQAGAPTRQSSPPPAQPEPTPGPARTPNVRSDPPGPGAPRRPQPRPRMG